MRFLEIEGRSLSYRLLGDEHKPLVVLAHPLGMNQSAWDEFIPNLLTDFRLLTWDLPGHGASSPWPLSKARIVPADLANDLLSLISITGSTGFHFIGTSIGGVIGQELLKNGTPQLLSVTLTNTGTRIGNAEKWSERAERAIKEGLAALAPEIVPRWFAPAFLSKNPALNIGWQTQMSAGDSRSYALLCEMLAEVDFTGKLGTPKIPLTLIGGDEDVATPPATLEKLANEFVGESATILAGVGHVPSVEAPEVFAKMFKKSVCAFTKPDGYGAVHYEQGLMTRKAILGDDHVERANENQTTLDAPFQRMITRLAWGELWGNADLSRQERSMITIALLAALGRDGELELHLKTAMSIPLSEDQLRQALMHVAVYAGVPAANHAFSMAKRLGWGTSL